MTEEHSPDGESAYYVFLPSDREGGYHHSLIKLCMAGMSKEQWYRFYNHYKDEVWAAEAEEFYTAAGVTYENPFKTIYPKRVRKERDFTLTKEKIETM